MNRASAWRTAVSSFWTAPVRDLMGGLDGLIGRGGARALAVVAAGLAVGWWLYVPAHELLHAAACLAAGGEVSRLEIAPIYGGALLERWFAFVVAGGEYAGRLSGFDTHGSDLVYLATDTGPYLLTLWPGVWALRRAGRRGWPLGFGAAVPVALAPFVSLPGDAYEIGSILSTRFLAGLSALPAPAVASVRGDDVFRVAPAVAAHAAPGLWFLFAVALVLAVGWAFATYWLAGRIAGLLGEAPLRSEKEDTATPSTGGGASDSSGRRS